MNNVSLVRLVADWLAGANGINAKLATIPLDSGDSVPTSLVGVLDETRDLDTGLGRLPEDSGRPCAQVAIVGDSELDAPGQVTPIRDYTTTVGVRIGLSKVQTQNGARDLYYYIKATLESLLALRIASEASRTRGQVYLESPIGDAIRVTAPQAIADDETITALVSMRCQARDQS